MLCSVVLLYNIFFFFKQKTAYEMRMSDWSSDVCSSDLGGRAMIQIQYRTRRLSMRFFMLMLVLFVVQVAFGMLLAVQHIDPALLAGTLNFNIAQIGRASCRERVGQYV